MKTTTKTTKQTKQARAAALLLELSSAYQEDAITTTAENLKDYKNAQEFAEDCCYQYRDNLKAAGYKGEAIYKGFRSFGDETELNAVALEYFAIMTEKEQTTKQKPKTNKGKYNAIIKQAEKINAQLKQLQEKAQALADSCREFGDLCDYDMYIYELADLARTAEDLAAFDLEDSIPNLARYNF